ncbi:spore germination protein [Paenibacillus sp. MMS18-CY102]|uniref:spore germination protein n=1 Tax=Paenibacillus sp. MMS18-CY102 TaxID=2682849 RepID=UPI00136604FE|nr:spore germination protein [Paenibacillus sp. MMS18-CY102]
MLSWIRTKPNKRDQTNESKPADPEDNGLDANLDAMLMRISKKLGSSSDLAIRRFKLAKACPVDAAAVYIGTLTDRQAISEIVLPSLMAESGEPPMPSNGSRQGLEHSHNQDASLELIYEQMLKIGEASFISDWPTLVMSVLSGKTVIIFDGYGKAISCCTKGGEKRSVTEPSTQVAIRGPKEGFNEALETNIALIRRRIKNPDLIVEVFKLGKDTQTDIGILHMQGKIDEAIVHEVKKRLLEADIAVVLESGFLEKSLEDQSATIFPTIYNTERPDAVSMYLLSGKVAILVDGTPFALIVPTVFSQFFYTPEDYYDRADIRVFLRALRYISFFVSLLLPSLYIAAITFHQDMIPTTFLIHTAAAREGIPFPAFVEASLMELSFEVLREAGIRMPRALGPAISIVGALVLGQAAVQAGIVSTAMLIVVSITGIASFATPAYNLAIAVRLIRLLFMIMAATLGFYGIVVTLIVMLAHLSSLRSFGVPYLSSFNPFRPNIPKEAHSPDKPSAAKPN